MKSIVDKPTFNRAARQRRLLRRVLGSSRGRTHSLLAMTIFILGLILLLGSLNLAIGIYDAIRGDTENAEYLIVNKRVTMGGMLTFIKPTFNEKEIEELKNQPFTADLGEFNTNRFKVSLLPNVSLRNKKEEDRGTNIQMPFAAEIFFESVPSRFLEIDLAEEEWEWSPESHYLPMIMSRDFLHLYNFSFALAQGLPQIPESLVGSVSGRIRISGPGGHKIIPTRIIGLSDRIPSLIVPPDFIQWGNKNIAQTEQRRPSRLIIKTAGPGDPAMLEYFQEQNLQVNSERLRDARVSRIALATLSVAGGTGAIFVGLALLLFIMLSRLIIAESGNSIRLLLQLGYSPKMLIKHAMRRFWFNLLLVAVISGGILLTGLPFLYDRLSQAGLDLGPALLPSTGLAGLILLTLTAIANTVSVSRAIARHCELNGK